MKPDEKNYPTYDSKFEIVGSEHKILRYYLYGVKCEVFTDLRKIYQVFTYKKLNKEMEVDVIVEGL